MIFGGYDDKQFTGNLEWFKLINNNWWALDLKAINYGSSSIASFSTSDEALAIIDTGTSLACLPKKYFSKVLSEIQD